MHISTRSGYAPICSFCFAKTGMLNDTTNARMCPALFLRELLLAFSVFLRNPSILSCLLSSKSLGTIVLRHGLDNRLLFLGVDDGDGIGEGLLGTGLAFWVAATHDLDLNTQNTLSEEDVAGSSVDEVVDGLAGVDHEAVLSIIVNIPPSIRFEWGRSYSELHALCSSSTQLARNNHLATLGTALHDESQHTVACSSHGQTVQQLVSERFALGDGRETAVLDLGGIEGNAVLGELESLLDERGEFADSSTLFAQDFLGVCRPDDCSTSQIFIFSSSVCFQVSSVLMSVTVGVTRTSTPE